MAFPAIGKLFARKPAPSEWTVVPATAHEIDAVVRHCRRLVSRRALVAAGVATVPLPGVDWVTDVAVLVRSFPRSTRRSASRRSRSSGSLPIAASSSTRRSPPPGASSSAGS